MIIYKATNLINGKIYIGQTTQTLEKRKKQHKNSIKYAKSKCRVFARALKKYGVENFSWSIVDIANSIEELNAKESYWIQKLDTIVDHGKGYNLNTGGSNPNHSEETKRLIGEAQLGKKNHMYGITGKNNHTSKKVINIATNMIYDSATICSEKENIDISKICAVCRGERATTNNKVFRYLDEKNNIIEPSNHVIAKSKSVINMTTNEIFNSMTEVGRKYNKSPCNLGHSLALGNGICWWNNNLWRYQYLEKYKIPKKRSARLGSKKVLNITTGVTYDSITLAGASINKNYRNLATALRKGNGEAKWNGYEWKLL